MSAEATGKKTREVTTAVVSGLLMLATLCLGVRHAVEAARGRENGNEAGAGREGTDAIHLPKRARPGAEDEAATLDRRLRAALASSNEANRTRRLLELMEDFQPQDWAAVLAMLRGLGMERSDGFGLILAGWMEQEPKAALRWALEQKLQLQALQVWALVKIWVGRDPDAALREVKALDESYPGAQLLQTAIATLAARDLPRATREMEEVCAKGGGFYVLEMMVSEVGRLEPGVMREWIDSLDPKIRKTAIDRMMVTLPASRTDVMLGLMRDYPEIVTADYYPTAYSKWAAADEAAAMASFEAMEPGYGQRKALEGLVSYLSFRGQPERGMALMDRYPEEIDDRMIGAWLDGDHADRENQMAQVPRIKDEDRRVTAYETLLSEWRLHDPAGVMKWVNEHELPTRVRQEFGGK